MSDMPEVKTVESGEEDHMIDAMMLAFSTDPLGRYAFPSAKQYLNGMRIVFEGLGGNSFKSGGAFHVGDFGGGAFWCPPGVHPDGESMGGAVEFIEPSRLETFLAVLGEMGTHHPEEPHWYLQFIGVDSHHQGGGYGAAMMKHVLAKIDEEGTTAYLESSNPRNLTLYERFGFEVITRIEIGDAPPIHPMVRPAR